MSVHNRPEPPRSPHAPHAPARIVGCGREGCGATEALAWSWLRWRFPGADAEQPKTSFGQLLRTLRLARALTQEKLAERAGLSTRGISDLERGARRDPRRATVRKLAEALAADEQMGTDS